MLNNRNNYSRFTTENVTPPHPSEFHVWKESAEEEILNLYKCHGNDQRLLDCWTVKGPGCSPQQRKECVWKHVNCMSQRWTRSLARVVDRKHLGISGVVFETLSFHPVLQRISSYLNWQQVWDGFDNVQCSKFGIITTIDINWHMSNGNMLLTWRIVSVGRQVLGIHSYL